jgi:hypothetical protein
VRTAIPFAILGVAALGYALASRPGAEAAPPSGQTAGAVAPAAATAPADAALPARDAAAAPAGAPARPPVSITYPDGSTMPALNGAKDPVVLQWPPHRPFTPVVEKVVDHGQEWYRHADGVWSTTVTHFDDAARIERTVGQVWVPGKPKPTRLKS